MGVSVRCAAGSRPVLDKFSSSNKMCPPSWVTSLLQQGRHKRCRRRARFGRARRPWRRPSGSTLDSGSWAASALPGRRGGTARAAATARRGPVCRIEVDRPWRAALAGLERNTHLQVLYWMHEARRDLVTQTPNHTGAASGTFSIRSPNRPNPIASSLVEIVQLHDDGVSVRGLDCLDGTPLVDLKPEACPHDGARPQGRRPDARHAPSRFRSRAATLATARSDYWSLSTPMARFHQPPAQWACPTGAPGFSPTR